jgi:hypothetical protein
MEAALAKYKSLLEQEKAHHALNVAELERRNVMEKDRLKNEMLRKIRETKLSLLAMTEDQLHTTTKRTIMENEQVCHTANKEQAQPPTCHLSNRSPRTSEGHCDRGLPSDNLIFVLPTSVLSRLTDVFSSLYSRSLFAIVR